MSIKTIPIKDITKLDDLNVRAGELLQAKVAEYAEIFDRLPPVSVFKVGPKLYLVDGWHRHSAAAALGLEKIPINIVGEGTFEQAEDEADRANLQHGIMLTPDQRRAIAMRFKGRHPDWSNRQVAKEMSVAPATIDRWWAAVKAGASNEAVDGGMSENGRSQRASQSDRAGGVDVLAVSLKFKQWEGRLRDPVDEWPPERRAHVKKALQPIVEFYSKL